MNEVRFAFRKLRESPAFMLITGVSGMTRRPNNL
jgi:hypothetical protein